MPFITTEDNLTVLNLFSTDAPEKQESLLGAMREIVDSAAYPGWISSTVHSGVDLYGTANFIQWRSGEDLEARYAGEEFKHRTLPVFGQMTTDIRLLQNKVVFEQRRDSVGDKFEISPSKDDYTVIDVHGVADVDQDALVDALGPEQEWLLQTPGYRSHLVLKGLAARGVDGLFVVSYAQWGSKEAYDAFRSVPEADRSPERQKSDSRIASLATWTTSNTYRVVHTRSADQ